MSNHTTRLGTAPPSTAWQGQHASSGSCLSDGPSKACQADFHPGTTTQILNGDGQKGFIEAVFVTVSECHG